MKVNAIVLLVKDFDKCMNFYKDMLNLKVKNKDEGFVAFELEGDQEIAVMSLEAASKMISRDAIDPGKQGTHRILLAMFVQDTDKTYKELRAKGVDFVKPPTTQPWGQRTAYFRDPDGNLWEISHFISKE
jgi:catechol 2,3-dioxygenase-like lactoylglutathione lyase family enzyme